MSGLLDRGFARWYPAMMSISERSGQSEIRRAHLAGARGRILEIGAGSGMSVPHYPDTVTELVLVEPDPHFRSQLMPVLAALPPVPWSWSVLDADAHRLPFEDASFDTVTASFVFCSIARPTLALREIHRVLRPDGIFLFHEHVRGQGFRGRLQDLLAPLQVAVAGGCHPNRDFVAELRRSPLAVEKVTPGRMPRSFPTVSPVVHGTASRAGVPAEPASPTTPTRTSS